MKFVLFLTGCFCFLSPHARSFENNCRPQAASFLKEATEIFVFQNHPYWHEHIDCESKTLGMEVVIHEAVHFEDLGAPHGATNEEIENYAKQWSKEKPRYPNFSLYAIDGRKHGEMSITNAPKPHELINLFLKNHHPDLLLAESSNGILRSLLDGYINDPESLSYYSFTQGLVTEINAYAHGLRIEHRIKGDNAEILNGRYGLLGFIFFFKAYLYQLKESYPSAWKALFDSGDIKQIQVLFAQSAQILKATQHCANMDASEKKDVFSLISVEKLLGPLAEVLQNNDSIKTILCR